jgi:hypothetical protein
LIAGKAEALVPKELRHPFVPPSPKRDRVIIPRKENAIRMQSSPHVILARIDKKKHGGLQIDKGSL